MGGKLKCTNYFYHAFPCIKLKTIRNFETVPLFNKIKIKRFITKSLFPMKCSHPNMLTKKRIAGMLQVIAIMTITLFPVRHARYLAAILTEQNLSMAISINTNVVKTLETYKLLCLDLFFDCMGF